MTGDPPSGNPLAPEALVDRYGERVFRLARRMTHNDADAEDVTQNVLMKVFEKADAFRGDSDPMGWIYRITVNEAREHHRRRGRRPAVSLDALSAEVHDDHLVGVTDFSVRPERRAMAAEIDEVVRQAIQELPDGYREPVVLMDLEGLSYKAAAEVLGLTVGAFKTRLHRARLHLRRRLQEFWRSVDEGRSGTDGGARG